MVHSFSFPGLGLDFAIDRVAFTLFGHNIYWYGVIIAAGFLLAVLYACRIAPRFGVDPDSLIDMLFFAVPLSIIGARIYYVIFYLSRFQNADGSLNWGNIIAIWDGGIAVYGSIIAAVLTVIVFCKARKRSAWAMMDVGCYGLLIGQAVGRWGNFVNVEAFGSVTGVPWRMSGEYIAGWLAEHGQLTDTAAYDAIVDGSLGVHPTFFYESMWNVIGFCLLVLLAKKWRKCDGQMFLSYVVWYGAGRFFIEGLRTDSLYFFSTGIRVSQLLALVSAGAAAGILVYRIKHKGPATPPLGEKPAAPKPAAPAAPKPVVPAAPKPAAQPAAKPTVPITPKPAAQPAVKTPPKPAAKPMVQPAPKAPPTLEPKPKAQGVSKKKKKGKK